ncbi:MAG: hypothetical protein ACHQ16_04140, partial [Candidatus Lutacidiplasmatales archaeon]
ASAGAAAWAEALAKRSQVATAQEALAAAQAAVPTHDGIHPADSTPEQDAEEERHRQIRERFSR